VKIAAFLAAHKIEAVRYPGRKGRGGGGKRDRLRHLIPSTGSRQARRLSPP